jgi:hypothetical protein
MNYWSSHESALKREEYRSITGIIDVCSIRAYIADSEATFSHRSCLHCAILHVNLDVVDQK